MTFYKQRLQIHDDVKFTDVEFNSFDEFIQKLQDFKSEHTKSTIFNVTFESEYESSSVQMKLEAWHMETDVEYEQRRELHNANKKFEKERAKQRRIRTKELELAELARLQKKYSTKPTPGLTPPKFIHRDEH